MHSLLRSTGASLTSVTPRSSPHFLQHKLCRHFQTKEFTLHRSQRSFAFCELTMNNIDELEHKSHRSVTFHRIGQRLSEIFGSPTFRGCKVYGRESSQYLSDVIRRATLREGGSAPKIIHSDNGSPMKGTALLRSVMT